jgi:homoserine kinase
MARAPAGSDAKRKAIMHQITVRVPASTSNLGPGFDCLGVALRLYNAVSVRRGGRAHREPIVREAAARFFERSGCAPFQFTASMTGVVPISRGLGSSVTVRLGLITALNVLAGKPLGRQELFQLCAELEGHPDNAAPAAFGGFNVAQGESSQRFAVSGALKFVLLIPNFEVSTSKARALLPKRLARLDAVESCGKACTITAAFASREYENLRGAFQDHLHQPYRKKLIPFFDKVVAAAEGAGALGTFISGSGSTIASVTLVRPAMVADAMAAAAPKGARIVLTTADNRGAHIVSK